MRKDAKKVVRECQICQVTKHETSMPAGLLQPLPIPHQPWTDIFMDFIDGLPISKGLFVMFIVVDKFTKFSYFFHFSSLHSSASS